MKRLAFTTAIALALATTAYAADHGGRGPGGGGGPGMSMGGGGPGPGSAGPSANFRGPSNFSNNSGPSTMGPNRGPSGLYNKGPTNMNSYKSGGPDRFSDHGNRYSDRDRGHERLGDRDRDHDRHLYNRADRDDRHFDRDRHEGHHNFDHRGIVSGNFFEHGRHFRFRRFFNGAWVFLNDWDDCTAFAWVHVAPGVWAWRPVDICIG